MSAAWRMLLVAGGALALMAPACNSEEAAKPRPTPAPSASVAPPGARSNERVPALQLGDQRTYAASLSSEARIDQSVLTQFDLKAELDVTALEVSSERVVVQAALHKAKLDTSLVALQADFKKLEPDLKTPFAFEVARGGVIRVVYFSDEPSGLVIGIRRSLAAALQAPVPRSGAAWVAEEFDATGSYQAEYRPKPQLGKFEKRKLRYVSFSTEASTRDGDATSLMPLVDKSEGVVELATSGVVEAVKLFEQQHSSSGQMLPIVAATRLELSTLSVGKVAPDKLPEVGALLAKMQRYDPDRPWFPKGDSPEVDKAKIAGRTLPQILAALRELNRAAEPASKAAKEAHQHEQREVYVALEALIRQEPSTVPVLVGLVLRRDELAELLLDALGSSSSPKGHKALASLIRGGKLNPTQRKVAAIALSRTPRPSAESVKALRGLLSSPDLHAQALLGMGTSCRRLREAGDEQRALALLDVIIDRLQRTSDVTEQVILLRAIANAGMDQAYPVVEPLLSDKNDELRAAAVESLQLMERKEAERALVRSLTTDQTAEVRLAVTRAARLRKPSPTLEHSMVQTAHGDNNPHVRLGALRALVKWLRVRPELKAAIVEIAQRDKEETIQVEAKAALQAEVQGS